MRGSVGWQVNQVFAMVKAFGESKHEAKTMARAGGATTWAALGKEIGVFSFATADAYRAIWRSTFQYAKIEFGIKDLEKLNGEHASSFLATKIGQGVSRATFDQYAAALSKLEVALNRYAEAHMSGYQYQFDLREIRGQGAKELGVRNEPSRAYTAVDNLVAKVSGETYHLAATLQRESGARVSEINHIREGQLKGVVQDRQSGQAEGRIEIQGKGGKVRDLRVSPQTYGRLAQAIAQAENGRFQFDKDFYRDALKAAALASRQEYQGSHGLRWSWAQEQHHRLQRQGLTYEQSLAQISREMGHERSDITEHYLR